MYLQISTLLSINQMWVVHPEVVVLNPDETAFVLHEEKIISINRVISVVEPPLTIMEVHNYRLSALDFQVMIIDIIYLQLIDSFPLTCIIRYEYCIED